MTVPAEFCGLWQREVLIAPDGRRDAATFVVWLQTTRLFADLRIPAGRPNGAGRHGFEDFSDDELIGLAKAQGFAGSFEVEGNFCRWHRPIDFHPPGDAPDEATWHFENGVLIETGIHAPYREDWRRVTPPAAPIAAWVLAEDSAVPAPSGQLVIAGDYFIAIESRRTPLPPGSTSLASLVADDLGGGHRDLAIERLDMPIAFGCRGSSGWEITLSTLPWREGQPLFADGVRYDPATGALYASSPARRQRWELDDATTSLDEIGTMFPAAE